MMFPRFVLELSPGDIDTIKGFSPDQGELLMAILNATGVLGEQASLAALVEHLRFEGVDCEQLIQETVGQEFEAEPALQELKGAVRQIKLRVLSSGMEKLFSSSLTTEEKNRRYYELKQQQEALQKEMSAENLQQ